MSDLSPKTLKRLLALHNMAFGSEHAAERATAMEDILTLLKKYEKSTNDLPGLLAAAEKAENAPRNPDEPVEPPAGVDPKLNALALTIDIVGKYIDVKPHEQMAIALWVLHTHVYLNFSHSPRLALLSPTSGCGKSTVFALFGHLTPRPKITTDITPAAIFRLINDWEPTLMLDEMDNADLRGRKLRAIVNAGHSRSGGTVDRASGEYQVFGPMALAAIGHVLPIPLMKRCIVIDLQRSPKRMPSADDMDGDPMLPYVLFRIKKWTQDTTLNSNPKLPDYSINRTADNWRSLIAIGDSFGPEWSHKVRDVAEKIAHSYRDDDAAVTLLRDIKLIVDSEKLDPIFTAELLSKLHALEGGDMTWSEWRGPKDDRSPRKLTANDLGGPHGLLGRFGIKSHSQWTAGGRKERRGGKGYRREQFELAWARYCPDDDTPAHTNKIKLLKAS